MKWEYGESISDSFQVLGFAAFFALVLKKVEHEDEENTAINGPLSAPGNWLQSLKLLKKGKNSPSFWSALWMNMWLSSTGLQQNL